MGFPRLDMLSSSPFNDDMSCTQEIGRRKTRITSRKRKYIQVLTHR